MATPDLGTSQVSDIDPISPERPPTIGDSLIWGSVVARVWFRCTSTRFGVSVGRRIPSAFTGKGTQCSPPPCTRC